VVTIATPACFHKDAAVLAAARGRHIFSEKPIALTLGEADAVLAAVARSGVKYSVCHQRRLGKSFQKVQELLADGAIGRPVLYRGNFSMGIRPKVLMHDRRGNGGPVIDFCCHWFDLWRWYFGSEPANVTGRGFVLARDKPELSMIQEFAIDTASFVVEYQSGDVAGVNISWGTPPNIGAANLEDFIGPLGVLQATGQKVTIITRGGETVYEGLQTDLDAAIVHDFAQAIREDREPAVTGADAREALRGSLAVLESIEKRTTVVW
jgi:predicted dehydrogenase